MTVIGDDATRKIASEDSPAALIQRIALATLHPDEQFLHVPYLADLSFEFRKLLLRKFSPTFGGGDVLTKTEKQLADFAKSEAEASRALHYREAMERCGVVAPLAADAMRTGEYAELLVISDCGGPKTDLAGYL